MMSPHQMPAANPEPERLGDEKNIHARADNNIDPAVPVRTQRRQARSRAALARSTDLAGRLVASPQA